MLKVVILRLTRAALSEQQKKLVDIWLTHDISLDPLQIVACSWAPYPDLECSPRSGIQ